MSGANFTASYSSYSDSAETAVGVEDSLSRRKTRLVHVDANATDKQRVLFKSIASRRRWRQTPQYSGPTTTKSAKTHWTSRQRRYWRFQTRSLAVSENIRFVVVGLFSWESRTEINNRLLYNQHRELQNNKLTIGYCTISTESYRIIN